MIRILITGAGFTHQFGAPLASSLWELIFNHPDIQKSNRIKSILLNMLNDFESAYETIIVDTNSSESDKNSIKCAINSAYDIIDKSCCSPSQEIKSLKAFFVEFLNRDRNSKNIFFTLNQDLFIERQLSSLWENSQIHSYLQNLRDKGLMNDDVYSGLIRTPIPVASER